MYYTILQVTRSFDPYYTLYCISSIPTNGVFLDDWQQDPDADPAAQEQLDVEVDDEPIIVKDG